jgi:hypothetical protein
MPGRCGLHLGGGVGPQSTLARRVPSTWLSSPRPSFSGGRCSEAGRPWSCWVRWSLCVLCCLRWCASNGGEGAWRHFRHLGERFRVRAASSARASCRLSRSDGSVERIELVRLIQSMGARLPVHGAVCAVTSPRDSGQRRDVQPRKPRGLRRVSVRVRGSP